eukprot:131895_1
MSTPKKNEKGGYSVVNEESKSKDVNESSQFIASPMFESEFKLSDYFYQHIDRRTRLLVIPTFMVIALVSIIMCLIGVIGLIPSIIALIIIIIFTLLGSFVGMFGLYRWGSVEDCSDYFKQKNMEYQDELGTLGGIKGSVREEAKNIYFSVGKLSGIAGDLEKNLNEFENLRKELEKVCDKNEELSKMLDEINNQYDDWQQLIYDNEKAHLTSIYYEISLRDGEHGLTKDEYIRFLGRLNKKTRKQFELQGGFDAMDKDGNGVVDWMEFDHMIDIIYQSVHEEEMKFIKQRSHL